MPDFPSYTRDELIERARNHLRLKVPGCDVGIGSDYDFRSRLIGTIAHQLQGHASTILRQVDKGKAFGAFLQEYGQEVARLIAPQAASGYVIIRSSAAATQGAGSVLTASHGLTYTLDADATTVTGTAASYHVGHRPGRRRVRIGGVTTGGTPSYVPALPAAGAVLQFSATSEYCAARYVGASTVSYHAFIDLWADLEADPETETDTLTQVYGFVAAITASATGSDYNRDPKDTLTIAVPVANVEAQTIVLELSGGTDAMSDGDIQNAIRDWASGRAPAFSMADLRDLYLENNPDLGEVYVSPGLYGRVDVLALGPAGRQAVTAAQAADLKAIAQPLLPLPWSDTAGPLVSTQSTGVQLDTSYSSIVVQCDPAYAPDWEIDPAYKVYGYYFVAASPASTVSRVYTTVTGIYVGARVIISSRLGAGFLTPTIEQRYVTAVGANYIDLDSPLTLPPNDVYGRVTPGGPVGDAVIEAIYTVYENMRPEVGSSARIIFPSTTSLDAETGLIAAIKAIAGVIDVATVAYVPITPVLAGIREPDSWALNMV